MIASAKKVYIEAAHISVYIYLHISVYICIYLYISVFSADSASGLGNGLEP